MRKTIYGIGSIFLIMGVLFTLFIIIAAINYDGKDPYHLSPSEFEKLYQNKENYSYIYFQQNNIFVCLDKNINKNDDQRTPKCKGHRRYIFKDELSSDRVEEISKNI